MAKKWITGTVTELKPGETRVAIVPSTVKRLLRFGTDVVVQAGCGRLSGYSDADYAKAGATVVSSGEEVLKKVDVLLKVQFNCKKTGDDDVTQLRPGQIIVAFLNPLVDDKLTSALVKKNVTAFAVEKIPRTARAQAMDALSSQASIAGYKAVVWAFEKCPKVIPLMMTAAGKIAPAKVLVVGAGVAGLQAIATAKRLGAIVYAYDARSVVKEQVQSLGARFVEINVDESADGVCRHILDLSPRERLHQVGVLSGNFWLTK